MRLIEFGTWKGIYTGGANYTCARVAVYGPIGFNVSDRSFYLAEARNEGFTCDIKNHSKYVSINSPTS